MPFYGGLGSGHSIRQTKLRYLNITVHSLHCHFDAVVVAVSDPQDRAYILEQVSATPTQLLLSVPGWCGRRGERPRTITNPTPIAHS